MPDVPPKYLTIAEAIAYLAERNVKVSDETIYRRVRAGKLKAKRLGGVPRARLLFAPEDLDALLEDAAA